MYNNTSTIKAVIENGKEEKMTNRELSYKSVITNSAGKKFVINMSNLYEKYYDILLDYAVTVELSEEEYLRVFKSEVIKLLNEILVLESENYIDNEMSVIKEINE